MASIKSGGVASLSKLNQEASSESVAFSNNCGLGTASTNKFGMFGSCTVTASSRFGLRTMDV